MSPDIDRKLLALVAEALSKSPFRAPGRWRSGVVILESDSRRVTSRADFAHWLAANDLKDAARECLSRRIAPGSILVWLSVDVPEVAATGFVAFDLATALRRKAAA